MPRLASTVLRIVGRVELLLRHRREQQAEAVEFDRSQDVFEQPIVVC